MQRSNASRGVTLVEITVASAILIIVAWAAFGLMRTSSGSSSFVFEQTRVSLDCQRALKFLKDEMRRTSTGSSGGLTYIPTPVAGVAWELRYFRQEPTGQLWAGGFNADDPYAGTTIVWSANQFVIRYEITETTTDIDGDFVTNEGRLVLYRDNAGTLEQVQMVAENIVTLNVTGPTVPSEDDGRPTLTFQCTTERVLRSAVDGQNLGAVTAGGGPRMRYQGNIVVALRN